MKEDIIFYLITRRKWKEWQNHGELVPPEDQLSDGFVRCMTGNQVESWANEQFKDRRHLLLLVINTSRLRSPIVWRTLDGFECPLIETSINLDAVMDKISLNPNEDGQFRIEIDTS